MAQFSKVVDFLREYEHETGNSFIASSGIMYTLRKEDYYAPNRVYVIREHNGNNTVLFELHAQQGLKKCAITNSTLKNLCVSLIDFRELLSTDINVSEDNKALLKELEDKGLL